MSSQSSKSILEKFSFSCSNCSSNVDNWINEINYFFNEFDNVNNKRNNS